MNNAQIIREIIEKKGETKRNEKEKKAIKSNKEINERIEKKEQ